MQGRQGKARHGTARQGMLRQVVAGTLLAVVLGAIASTAAPWFACALVGTLATLGIAAFLAHQLGAEATDRALAELDR